MEKRKRSKIIIFLSLVFAITLILAILGIIKKFNSTEVIEDNSSNTKIVEESVDILKLIYKSIKIDNGIYIDTEFKQDENHTLTLKDEVIAANVEDVYLFKIDNSYLLTYKKGSEYNITLYSDSYEKIITNDNILSRYKGYYISDYSLNDSGIVITIAYKDKEKECASNTYSYVKVLYRYIEKNKFDNAIILDSKKMPECEKTDDND